METLFWLCIGALLSWLLVSLGVLIYFGMKLCVFFTHTVNQRLYSANCKHAKHIYAPIKNTFAANQTNTEKSDAIATCMQTRFKAAFENLPQ